jgi:hypothetical protein
MTATAPLPTTMSLNESSSLHIAGGTFNQVAGHLNQYNVAGDLIQPGAENGELNIRFPLLSA